ncbi:glycoside hydrolase family 113 [Embleya sp. NPDC050154]|uniref:glycoside hydrolase family 113 n=1 Tax=unclassified Embleya TaxID=2699296 RepID=UPI0037ACDA64
MLTDRGISYLVSEANTDDVRRDMEVIVRDLHCTTVMLLGEGIRLIDAARTALQTGLDVYIRPSVPELPQPKLLEHLDTVAEAAEELRRQHPDRVTLLVGSEFSHTVPGIVPGPRSFLRLKLILRFRRLLRRRIDRRLHSLLTTAVATARRRFDGPLTYAAAGWEHVDWSLFDLVGVSLYRSARNHTTYPDRLHALVRDHDKPVVITEFGCGAFTGADQRGAGSFWIVNWFATPPRIRGDHPRDEAVQARYLGELIDQYDAEGVRGCFVFTYAMPDFPHHDDPDLDLDKAGFGVVAITSDGERRPKEAFHEVARRYHDIAAKQ